MEPPADPRAAAYALHEALLAHGRTVAVAESLTGGELAALLSATPGASTTFLGGVVGYATSVKTGVLGVSGETVDTLGVVSGRCAEEMAAGVRRLAGADHAVSTTGVAGPTEQEGRPVGRVYVGLAGPTGVHSVELDLDGDREQIRRAACAAAIEEVLRVVGDQ